MVQILTGAALGIRPTLIMPTDAELRQLRAVVLAAHPKLDPSKFVDWRPEEAPRDERDFKHAFIALGRLGRLPEPETKNPHSAGYWAGYLNDVLSDLGINGDVRTHVMAAAILAHGDIPHCMPVEMKFGLCIGNSGTPARQGWRRVLAGAILPSSAPSEGWNSYTPPGRIFIDEPGDKIGLIRSVRR